MVTKKGKNEVKLLTRDQEILERVYYDAMRHIRESELRYECYRLALIKNRNKWQENRIRELLKCPACYTQWFVVMLRGDGKDNIEEFLIEAGL